MPKNKGKGGKNEADDEKRELVFKEDGLEYTQVLRMLGNGRCEALCIGGTKRLCHIRDKMHNKVWIAAGDIVLVRLRDYQDDKADIILKYMPDEAHLLKAYGELPETIRLNEGIAAGMDEEDDGGTDDYIEFEDETSTRSEGSSRAPLECGFNDCSAFSRSNSYHWCHADDEEALRWAALKRLPTFECVLRKIICCSDEGAAESSCHDSRRWKAWRSLTSYSRMHLTLPLDLEAIRCYKYQR